MKPEKIILTINGKELDRTHGLDWYDYGARQHDPFVPGFTSLAPLCEKYYHISPYAYCGNNPILLVDPNGMDWLLSTGDKVYWYGGEMGDDSLLLYTFNATSGNNENGKNYQEYTEGYLIPTSISEDQKIIDGALEEINKDYFALGSNFAWTVQNALNNAGKNGGSGFFNKRPKDVIYPKIIKNNPGGTLKLFYNTANRTYYKNK